MKVKRRSDFVLTITKPGYETVTVAITSSVDGAGVAGMAGNVLLGGLIGAGVDARTGAMHSHKPNPLVVEIVPVGSVPKPAAAVTASGDFPTPLVPPASDVQLRAVDKADKQDCEFIKPITKGASGSGDPSANVERAMSAALQEAAASGANSYFIVNTDTTATGASAVIEALKCN